VAPFYSTTKVINISKYISRIYIISNTNHLHSMQFTLLANYIIQTFYYMLFKNKNKLLQYFVILAFSISSAFYSSQFPHLQKLSPVLHYPILTFSIVSRFRMSKFRYISCTLLSLLAVPSPVKLLVPYKKYHGQNITCITCDQKYHM